MILKNTILPLIIIAISVCILSCDNNSMVANETMTPRPVVPRENREEENSNPDKLAAWTAEQAARHQEKLAKLPKISSP